MRHLLIVGFSLGVLAATCAAQDARPRVKHFPDTTRPTKSVVVGKTPPSPTPEANLRQLEQQSIKVSAPPKVKRTPATAALPRTEKEKPNPPINFSGSSNGAKSPGTTNLGTNPYRGRLRQKGPQH